MCTCVSVHVFACANVFCVSAYERDCMHTYVCACALSVCTYPCAFMDVYMCVCAHACACVCKCAGACVYAYALKHMCENMYVDVTERLICACV
jgi:hypothetical protein